MELCSSLKGLCARLIVGLLVIPGVLAQDNSLTGLYVAIFIIGGLVFTVGPLLWYGCKTYFCNKESKYYGCFGVFGDNSVSVEHGGNLTAAERNQLTEGQRRMFESMGQSNVAKTSMATIDNTDRSDWHTPPEKENQVVEDLHVEMMNAAKGREGPREHILLTYEPSVRSEVIKFRKRLKKERYRVWFDEEQLEKYANDQQADAMAKAVKDAAVVVPVLTQRYEANAKCKKEIEYADLIKKTLIPVRMQKKYRPDGWLAFLLGNTLFHDLANEDTYQSQIDNFLEAIETVGANAKIGDDDFDED